MSVKIKKMDNNRIKKDIRFNNCLWIFNLIIASFIMIFGTYQVFDILFMKKNIYTFIISGLAFIMTITITHFFIAMADNYKQENLILGLYLEIREKRKNDRIKKEN